MYYNSTFPFFNLPDEVIVKILKEYVFIFDKFFTLSKIPEFQTFLSNSYTWSASSYKIFDYLHNSKGAWFRKETFPFKVTYLSKNEKCKTFSFHHFYIKRHVYSNLPRVTYTMKMTFFNIQELLEEFFKSNILEKNINIYKYKKVYFSIYTRTSTCNVIQWWDNLKTYPISNNQCSINTLNEKLKVIIPNNDGTVLLKCIECPKITHCIYPKTFEKISPLKFHFSHSSDKNFPFDTSLLQDSIRETSKFTFKRHDSSKVLSQYEWFGEKLDYIF